MSALNMWNLLAAARRRGAEQWKSPGQLAQLREVGSDEHHVPPPEGELLEPLRAQGVGVAGDASQQQRDGQEDEPPRTAGELLEARRAWAPSS